MPEGASRRADVKKKPRGSCGASVLSKDRRLTEAARSLRDTAAAAVKTTATSATALGISFARFAGGKE
jgi:hypothetical protein